MYIMLIYCFRPDIICVKSRASPICTPNICVISLKLFNIAEPNTYKKNIDFLPVRDYNKVCKTIPLREEKHIMKRISYNSPVILTFTFAAFAALLLNYFTAGMANELFFSVYRSSLLDPLFYLRLFTHILGHADLNHFVGNFTLILLIGPMLEEKYGSKPLLIMMIVTAFLTGLINVIFFPTTALLGASGIAFMMIILGSFVNVKDSRIPLTFILAAIFYIGGEILDGIFLSDSVSQMAHILGGICGGLGGKFVSVKRK